MTGAAAASLRWEGSPLAEWWQDVAKGAGAALLGGGGVWAWLQTRAKRPADLLTAQAAFQAAMNNQVEAFTRTLVELTASQARRIDDLQGEVADLSARHEACESENRQLHSKHDALVRRLRAAGVELPQDLPLDKVVLSKADPPDPAHGVTEWSGER